MGEVFKVKGVEVGGIYSTNRYGDFVVEGFLRKKVRELTLVYAEVKFITTGFKKLVAVSELRRGRVKDPYYPILYGLGFFGEPPLPLDRAAYNVWVGILRRCYDTTCKEYKYYGSLGVTVSEEWHCFAEFLKYYNKEYIEGFQLDKDLLSEGEIKEYSPTTCCFLPPKVNMLLAGIARKGGVSLHRLRWCYGSNGTLYPSKSFLTKKEAYQYRSECFQKRLLSIEEEFSAVLSDKVLSAITALIRKEIDKV